MPHDAWSEIGDSHEWHGGKGVRNEEQYEAADRVRKDGNEAVHQRPSEADPLDYIVMTLSVLAALERGKKYIWGHLID